MPTTGTSSTVACICAVHALRILPLLGTHEHCLDLFVLGRAHDSCQVVVVARAHAVRTDDIKVTSKSLHWQFDPLKPSRIVLHSANARLEARRLKRSASSMYKTPWYYRGRQISRGRQFTNCVCSWFQNDSQSFKWLKATLGSDVCKQYKVFVAQRKCHRRWACCPPFHATARPITMHEEKEEL